MIGDDTYAYRRRLPHLQKAGKHYFITFRAFFRFTLPPIARTAALSCCLHDKGLTYWLHCVVIMPTHVHMLITPYEGVLLAKIMSRVKSVSARPINDQLSRVGHVWQREYFDHIVRSEESLQQKAEYICQNPVRAGLVADARHYEWTWNRYWNENAAEVGGATP